MKRVSERRLVENEVTFREANEMVLRGLAELDALAQEDAQPEHRPSPALLERLLHFYCECSSTGCVARVQLTMSEYERMHKIRNRFVVLPGHERLEVERVVGRHEPEYVVVEKIAPVPLPNLS